MTQPKQENLVCDEIGKVVREMNERLRAAGPYVQWNAEHVAIDEWVSVLESALARQLNDSEARLSASEALLAEAMEDNDRLKAWAEGPHGVNWYLAREEESRTRALSTEVQLAQANRRLATVEGMPEKWRARAANTVAVAQFAAREQRCVAQFRADDEKSRADELDAALQPKESIS